MPPDTTPSAYVSFYVADSSTTELGTLWETGGVCYFGNKVGPRGYERQAESYTDYGPESKGGSLSNLLLQIACILYSRLKMYSRLTWEG